MDNNNGEKGYYSVVNINEGTYYEIDVPFRLLKIRELHNRLVSNILDDLPDGVKRYEVFLNAGTNIFHSYVELTNKEYKILQEYIDKLVRVTTYNITGKDIMFVKTIKIEIDGELKTFSLF